MNTNRRQFIKTVGLATTASSSLLSQIAQTAESLASPVIMTVRGAIPANDLGPTLTHEHVTTDFVGAETFPQPRHDQEEAFRTILPYFLSLKKRGVNALFECTPNHIGRDVKLLRQLSEASDVHIITNTGYYGAVGNKFMPKHAYTETTEQLTGRWLNEWENGIDGTDIRPGFIKLGVETGKLPPLHAKLVRAAAMVHQKTGLTICIHTGNGEAALDELRILGEEGISPEAFVWVHAQNDAGPIQIEVAKRGGWVSLDGYSLATRNPERYKNMLIALKESNCLNRVLVSHDDGWAVEGDAAESSGLKRFGNGNPKPYTSIFERLIPDLKQVGFTSQEISQLTQQNPAKAFTLRARTA